MSSNHKRYLVDSDSLPDMFPTHRHTAEFWENLGRAVATFGFLEETIGKAIFALSGTTEYSEEKIQEEMDKWLPKLEKALSNTLDPLINTFGVTLRNHQSNTIENLDDLIADLKKAAKYRNVICHGSWRAPDADGKSKPFFVNRQKEVFDTPIDAQFLKLIQKNAKELCCSVINVVTHMGYQFPGSNGPGTQIWETKTPPA